MVIRKKYVYYFVYTRVITVILFKKSRESFLFKSLDNFKVILLL